MMGDLLFRVRNKTVYLAITLKHRVSQKKRNTNSTGYHASHVEFNDLILT